MKKIILYLVLSISCLYGINLVHAADPSESSTSSGDEMTIIVQEKVPGANCGENLNPGKDKIPQYKCTIKKGFGSVIDLMGSLIKYFTYLAALGGVFFIVINGIMYSMAGADNSLETKAKDHIKKMSVGLIILFLSGMILNFIAPWIYK